MLLLSYRFFSFSELSAKKPEPRRSLLPWGPCQAKRPAAETLWLLLSMGSFGNLSGSLGIFRVL